MDDRNVAAIAAPFETTAISVRPEWIDYNGHMNVAYYVMAFDLAFDELYKMLHLDPATVAKTGISTFTVEKHVTYQQEVHKGDRLRIVTQLLGFDDKRAHYIQLMYHADEGYLAATDEWLILCVDLKNRRAASWPEPTRKVFEAVQATHSRLPPPPEAGRKIELKAKRPR
jgi:acyl-CoA thioester hydrolase